MLRRALWSHVLGRRGPSWHGHVSSHRLPWWSSYNPWRWDCTRKGPIVLRSWCFSHQIVVQRQGINLEKRFADRGGSFAKITSYQLVWESGQLCVPSISSLKLSIDQRAHCSNLGRYNWKDNNPDNQIGHFHLLLQPGHVRWVSFSCRGICLMEHWQEGGDLVLVENRIKLFSVDHQPPGQWFPGQGMSPAPLLSPPPDKFSVRKLEKALLRCQSSTSSLKTTLLFRSPRASESRSVVTKLEGKRPCEKITNGQRKLSNTSPLWFDPFHQFGSPSSKITTISPAWSRIVVFESFAYKMSLNVFSTLKVSSLSSAASKS